MVFVIQNDDQRLVVDQSRTVLQGDFRLSNNFTPIPLISNTYVSDRLLASAGELATQSSNIVVGQSGRTSNLRGFLYGDGSRLSFNPNLLYEANEFTASTWVKLSEMAADIPVLYANAAVQTSNLANLVSNAVSQSNILYILSTSFSSHEARLIALESMDRTLPDMNRLPSLESANTYYTNILLNGNALVQSVNVPLFINGNTMYWSNASVFAVQHGYARQNISTLSETSNVSFASLYASNTAIWANVSLLVSLNGSLPMMIGELVTANTHNWGAVSALQTSNTLVWSNVNALNVSNGLVWSNVNALNISNGLVWSNVNALNTSNTLIWPLVDALQTSNTLIWPLVDALNVFNGLVWSNVGALNTSNTLVWSNVGALNVSNGLVWTNVNALNTSNGLIWSNVDALNVSNGLIWSNVDALNTSNGLIWPLVDALNVSNGLVWSNVGALNTSNTLVWSNVNALNTSNGLVWSNVNALNTSNTLVWSNVGGLQTSNAAAWAVVSGFLSGQGFNTTNTFQTGTFGNVSSDCILRAATLTVVDTSNIQVTEKCHFRYAFSGSSGTGVINVLSAYTTTFTGVLGTTFRQAQSIVIGRSGIYSLALNLPNTTTALQWAGFLSPSGFVAVNTQVGSTTHLSCQTAYTGWLQAGDVITPQMSYASAVTLPAANTWFEVSLIQEAASYNDPFYHNTVLMVHGYSRTFDSSIVPNTIVSGTPVYSTAIYRFGFESLSGTNTLTTSSSPRNCLGKDDFTVEFSIYLPGAQTIGSNVFISGVLRYSFTAANVLSSNVAGASVTLGYAQWNHVATVRRRTLFMTFLNGALVHTGTSNATMNTSTSQPFIIGGGTYQLQDIRVTDGVARYTAPFVPSAAPLPDTPENIFLTLGRNGVDLSSYRNDCTALVTAPDSFTGKVYTKPSPAYTVPDTRLTIGSLTASYVKPAIPELTPSVDAYTNLFEGETVRMSVVETYIARIFTSTAVVRSVAYNPLRQEILVGGDYSTTGTMTDHNGTGLNTFVTSAGGTVGFAVILNASGTLVSGFVVDGTGTDQVHAVAYDTSGNAYFGGNYNATSSIRSIDGVTTYGAALPNSNGGGFVVKILSDGSFAWIRLIDGTTSGVEIVYGIVVDAQGSVYTAGIIGTSALVRNQAGTTLFTLPSTSGGEYGCLIKFDSDGGFQWARLLDSTNATSGIDVLRGVACDALGGVYVVGHYGTGSPVIRNESGTTISSTFGGTGTVMGCLIKFLSDGTFVWATILTPATATTNQLLSITVDPTNTHVIVGGYYQGTSSWRNLTGTTTYSTLPVSLGGTVGIVASFDAATGATHRWSTIIDSTGADSVNGVAYDSSGSIYIGGHYSGAVTTRNASGTSHGYNLYTPSTQAGLLMKLNPTTGVPIWSYSYDGNGADTVNAVACSERHVFVAGTIATTTPAVSIYNQTTLWGFLPLQSSSSGFVIEHDATDGYFRLGNFAWDDFWYASTERINSVAVYTPPPTTQNQSLFVFGGSINGSSTIRNKNGVIVYTFPASAGGTMGYVFTQTWRSFIDGTGADTVNGVAYDPSGNVIAVGQFTGTATIRDGAGATLATGPTSDTSAVGFIVKYTLTGGVAWARIINGNGADTVHAVTCDPFGNIFMVGAYVTGTVTIRTFDGATTLVTLPTSVGGTVGFITKFNAAGVHQWTRVIDSAGADQLTGVSASETHVIASGFYTGTGVVKNEANTTLATFAYPFATSDGQTSGCALIFAQDGTWYNGLRFDGVGVPENIQSCAFDASGTFFYISGLYGAGAAAPIRSFDNVTTYVTPPLSVGGNAGFVSKFTLSMVHQWTRVIDGTSLDEVTGLSVQPGVTDGNICVSGYYVSSSSIRNGAIVLGTLRSPNGSIGSSGFTIVFNSSGTLGQMRSFDGDSTRTRVSCAMNGLGDVYVTYAVTGGFPIRVFNGTVEVVHHALGGVGVPYLIKFDGLANTPVSTPVPNTAPRNPVPPGAMTADTTVLSDGTYITSADEIFSGYPAWRAFDQTTAYYASVNGSFSTTSPFAYIRTSNTNVQTIGLVTAAWLQLSCPVDKVVSVYTVRVEPTAGTGVPSEFRLVGSMDGTTWFPMDYRTGLSWTTGETKTFTVPGTLTSYRIFRFLWLRSNGMGYVTIETIFFFETSLRFDGTTSQRAIMVRRKDTGACRYLPFTSNSLSINERATSIVDPFFNETILLLHLNGNVIDTSPLSATLTAPSDTYSTTITKFGTSSLICNGSTTVSSPASSTYLLGTSNFTIECWVYWTATDGTNRAIISNFNAGDTPGRGILYINSGQIRWDVYFVGLVSTTTLALNTWYHVAVVRSGNITTLYVNGISINSLNISGYPDLNASSQIHVCPTGVYSGLPFTNGFLDDIRITKGVARYTSNFTVPQSAFPDSRFLPLVQVPSSRLSVIGDSDISMNRCMIVSNGYPVATRAPVTAPNTRALALDPLLSLVILHIASPTNYTPFYTSKNVNGVTRVTSPARFAPGSLFFNGRSYIENTPTTVLTSLGAGDFTIEFWFTLILAVSFNALTNGTTYAANGWEVVVSTTSIQFRSFNKGTNFQISGTFNTNTWYHIAIVRRGNVAYGFVNGTLVTTDASYFTGITVDVPGRPIYIGWTSYPWARLIDSSGSDAAFAVTCDTQQSVYVSGFYNGTPLIRDQAGTTIGSLPVSSGQAAFLTKFDVNGNLSYSRIIDGTQNDQAVSTACDPGANVYVAGSYIASTASIKNETGGTLGTLPAASGWAAFASKFNSSGNYLYSRIIDSSGTDDCRAVVCDSVGNMYMAGFYTLSATIKTQDNATLGSVSSIGSSEKAIASKFDASGNYQWSRVTQSSTNGQFNSAACDASGNVYFAGWYTGLPTLRDESGNSLGTLPSSSGGQAASYVSKYTSSGTLQWTRIVDSSSDDVAMGVTCDPTGNVYMVGYYGAAATIKTQADASLGTLPAVSGGSAAFLSKFDANGTHLYSRCLDAGGNDYFTSVVCDSSSNVYVAGYYNGTPIIETQTGDILGTLPASSASAAFVIKFDSAGNYAWARILDDSGANADQGLSVTCDSSGAVSFSGLYSSSTTAPVKNETGEIIGTLPATTSFAGFVIQIGIDGNTKGFHLDDVRITQSVRYTSSFRAPTSRFPMQTYTTGVQRIQSVPSYNGTLLLLDGTLTFDSGPLRVPITSANVTYSGSSMVFGATSSLQTTRPVSMGSQWTIEMYVTVTTSDSTARPIFRNGDNVTRSTSVYMYTQSGILYAVAGTCITSVPISTGVSYHITLTWSLGTLSLYVNGLLFDSCTDTLQTLTYPPSSLGSATLVSGLRYTLNGYTIDASSTGSGFETRRAFDYNTSTFWLSNSSYSATTGNYFAGITTPTLLGTISGEWLEITSPTPIRLQSYSIRVRNDASFAQSPAIWYIVAENSFDTTWQVIDVKHNVTWTQGELKTFTIQNIGFYTSYRIIVTRTNFTSGIGPVGIAEFLLFGRGLSDLSVQTYYTLGGASFVGSVSRFQITSGLKYTRPFTPPGIPYMSLEYPPVALTSNVTTVSGQSYGNGVYTSGSSSGNGTEFRAFDKSYATTTWWQGSASYDADGLPTNPSSFVIDGLTVPCEWLSIQLPAPIILQSYMVRTGLPLPARAPASWFVAGSNDGVSWTRVDEEFGVVYDYDNQEFEFSVRSTVAYSRFAILVTSKQPSASIMQIGEWRLFGTPGVSTQRMITYDILPSIDTVPVLVSRVYFEYFNSGNFSDDVNWFTGRTPTSAGFVNDMTDINTATNGTVPVSGLSNFSVQWTGNFVPTISGQWTFWLESDDASYFWLGPNAVTGFTTGNANINNGGFHPLILLSTTITLVQGTSYPIRIQFGQGGGGYGFNFSFAGPSQTRTFKFVP